MVAFFGGKILPKGLEINLTLGGGHDNDEPPKLVDFASCFLAFIVINAIRDLITTKGEQERTEVQNQG